MYIPILVRWSVEGAWDVDPPHVPALVASCVAGRAGPVRAVAQRQRVVLGTVKKYRLNNRCSIHVTIHDTMAECDRITRHPDPRHGQLGRVLRYTLTHAHTHALHGSEELGGESLKLVE